MATKTFKIGLSATDKQNMAQDIYEKVEQLLFAEYDSSETYNTGDFVVYSDVLYRCKEDNVTGTWDSSKWESATLQDLLDDVEGAVASVSGKANTIDLENGTLVVAHAQVADGIETNVGKLDKTPFAFESSGGQTDITTGYQRTLKLVGSTIVNNQHYQDPDFSTGLNWSIPESAYLSGSVSNNKLTLTVLQNFSSGVDVVMALRDDTIVGHIIMFVAKVKSTVGNNTIRLFNYGKTFYSDTIINQGETKMCYAIGQETYSDDLSILRLQGQTSANNQVEVYQYLCIDLTQMFGSKDVVNAIIGNDTSKQVANLMLFLGGWLPTTYDTGTLIPSKSAYLKSVMYNQWDEEWELGTIDNTTGQNASSSSVIRSKNYIRVIPNKEYYYYGGNFVIHYYDINKNYLGNVEATTSSNPIQTTPNNACYMRFRMSTAYGTTYNHDICIFIYWDGSKIAYEPYEQKIEPLPNIEINGILKVDGNGKVYADGDELYPDGTGKRRYAVYTFTGSESWYLYGTSFFYVSLSLSENGKADSSPMMSNGIKALFNSATQIKVYIDNNPNITSSTDMNTIFTSGTKIIYELANETDITSTSFNENIFADDFGTLQFLDENNAEIVGLQGCEIFYKANVAGFAESVGINAEWEPENVLYKADKTELQGADTQLLNAIGGTLRNCLAIKENIDFNNTKVINLESLTFVKYGSGTTDGRFRSSTGLTDFETSNTKCLCSKFKGAAWSVPNDSNDMTIGIINDGGSLNGCIMLCDKSYTDQQVEQLNKDLKGVLLAYEKA